MVAGKDFSLGKQTEKSKEIPCKRSRISAQVEKQVWMYIWCYLGLPETIRVQYYIWRWGYISAQAEIRPVIGTKFQPPSHAEISTQAM